MTIRARLTATLVAVVVAPVLVGAGVVGIAAGAINRSRDADRLDVAATALATSLNATCDRLQAAADSAATGAGGSDGSIAPPADATIVASGILASGRASGVRFGTTSGATTFATVVGPPLPWTLCDPPTGTPAPSASAPAEAGPPVAAIAAAAPVLGPSGAIVGYAYAAQALDVGYVRGLSAGIGAGVTLVDDPHVSTESGDIGRAVAADRAAGVTATADRYVRRVEPMSGVGIAFALSVPEHRLPGLIPATAAIVLLAAALAIVTARSLARSALRRQGDPVLAADDITERAPGGANTDEIGPFDLALTRRPPDTQSFDALAAGRDRVRGHLDVLGQTLSSTHDLPRILRVILDAAIAATGARRGAVFLVDDRDGHGQLAVACSDGFDGSSGALPEPLSAGLLGSVATTGIARRGRVLPTSVNPNAVGAYLAVPMQLPTGDGAAARPSPAPGAANIRGVLALCDRVGGADFDEDDLRTVRTFAGHAAVAVDNVRLHDEARRLSHTDPLTGLYNYRHLQDMLVREINRSARFGHSLCVMALDLDHFKNVNDTYGHGAGDAVLVEFARRIRGEIRGVDLAFRAGGEEFVLLLPETSGAGGAVLAQRLGTTVRDVPMSVPDAFRATADLNTVELPLVRLVAPPPADGAATAGTVQTPGGSAPASRASVAVPPRHVAHVPITVSIGVAVFPEHGADGPAVLAAADAALYAAKSAGRDTFRVARVAPDTSSDRSPASPEPAAASTAADPGTPEAAPAGAGGAVDGAVGGGADRAVSHAVGAGVCPSRSADDGPDSDLPDGASTAGPPARASLDG